MASSYPMLRYGSSGQEVRRLQQALNRAGYSLEVDGGFGEKTRAALMDYQRRAGMTPDGVAGSKTWASLGLQSAQDRLADLEKGYTPSRETQEARRSWEELAARQPGDYINRIRELLPHRYPFQLVDKVVAIGANHIVGVKNVTANEPFFQGHFPQEPVMPGVLQVEAMAQCGGLLVLNSVDEPERYSTYFMKIDGVKFRQKVVPGDTLLFRVELLAPIRRGISTMKGYVFVGEKVVCEAEFMAQIVKNK